MIQPRLQAQYNFGKLSKILAWVLVLAYSFILFYRPLEFEDGWWHIKVGEWIHANKDVPRTEILNPINNTRPWVILQWMGSLIFYEVYRLAGIEGLKIFRALVFFAVFIIFVFFARKKLPSSLLLACVLILGFFLQGRCLMRPVILSIVFTEIFIILILLYLRNRNFKYLWALLPITALWGNIHSEAFVIGSVLIAAIIIPEAVAWLNSFISKNADVRGQSAKALCRLLIVFIGFLFMFTVSPYGPQGLDNLAGMIFDQDYKYIRTIILEHLPPKFGGVIYRIIMAALVAASFVLIRKNTKNNFFYFLLISMPFGLFLSAVREAPFFSVAVLFTIAEMAYGVSLASFWKTKRFCRWLANFIYCAVSVISALSILYLCHISVYRDNLARPFLLEPYYPSGVVKAVDFLKKNKVSGTTFNSYVYGGYLLFAGFPELKPVVDGRIAYLDLLNMHANVLEDPKKNWPGYAHDFNVKVALLESTDLQHKQIIRFLQKDPEWQMVFVSLGTVVFVKKGIFDLSEEALALQGTLEQQSLSLADAEALFKLT
ncbi:MAG: hypothetical protein HQL27_08500, partial [Candidatus Omnitrophica bacterium]|nr:hypothetical protein [Candidatus Omnitrophota bacterium]